MPFGDCVAAPPSPRAAVATLALGIGANAAIFALVDRVMLTLLPVREPRELVLLRSPGPKQGRTWSDGDDAFSFSYPMYRDLRDRSDVFSGLLGAYPFSASVAARGATERAWGELVSGNYFGVLGVPPALGRVFSAEDDRAPGGHPLTVLSHGYWVRRFGADPSVLNKTIVVNGRSLTVVGVAHAAFSGVQPGRRADLFVPLAMKASMTPFSETLENPKEYWLPLIGRLKPGLSRAEAEASLAATYRPLLEALLPLMNNWEDTRKKEFLNRRIELLRGGVGRTVMRESLGTPLLSLMGMVGLVLLIACSNLAGLLAARGVARQREYGIRLAIGASRRQLLRQSVVECLAFSAVGGILGLALAAWTLSALLSAFPPDADLRQVAVSIDPRVIGFAAVAVPRRRNPLRRRSRVPGRAARPGAHAARPEPRRELGRAGGHPHAGLARHGAGGPDARPARRGGPLHEEPREPRPRRPGPEARQRADLFGRSRIQWLRPGAHCPVGPAPERNARRLAGRPVGLGRGDRLDDGERRDRPVSAPPRRKTRKRKGIQVWRNHVGPAYFSTLGTPLVSGREFGFQDDLRSTKVAIVNETLARKFFPGTLRPRRAARHRPGQRPARRRDRGCRPRQQVGPGRRGSASLRVHAVPPGPEPRLSDLLCARRVAGGPPGAHSAQRRRGPGPPASGLRRQNPRHADPGIFADPAARFPALSRLRRSRGASRGDRHLRRPRVLGRGAPTGDRGPHGARGGPGHGAPPRALRGGPLSPRRRRDRPARRMGVWRASSSRFSSA